MHAAPSFGPSTPLFDAAALRRASTWVFDLDNTLYPAADNLFVQVSARIRDYIGRLLGISADDAHLLQRRYFEEYGTSLRGMMICHSMDPQPFLEYVHDVDLGSIKANPRLDAALAGLEGCKLIFTNASQDHARRVLERLGVAARFDAVFDIADADFIPKPEPQPYDALIRRHGLRPAQTVMIDDIARNLEPAAARGMTTAWVRNDNEWGSAASDESHVHYVVDDLVTWLDGLAATGTASPC